MAMKPLFFLSLVLSLAGKIHAQNIDALFEDKELKPAWDGAFFTSEKVDFIQIESTITPEVKIAMAVYKPAEPSRILLVSHGWHQSVTPPEKDADNLFEDFLTIQVDMRGRKFSSGTPDCNGYELYDFYDAYRYAISHYQQYILDDQQVYYYGSSGGGGNGYALVGKFPDLFCSAVVSCGMSDYAVWYRGDSVGEFRDEMDVWIGCGPEENPMAYQSRSGITTVENILTPVYITHGETDFRVPVDHARTFYEKAKELGKEVYYKEFENVGNREHWGNISEEQESEKSSFQTNGRNPHAPPLLPDKGRFIVAGYLITKEFSVFMNSIDSVGEIEYDIPNREVHFISGKGVVLWK